MKNLETPVFRRIGFHESLQPRPLGGAGLISCKLNLDATAPPKVAAS